MFVSFRPTMAKMTKQSSSQGLSSQGLSSLSIKDYKNILSFYKHPIPKSPVQLKKQAEDIMGYKLCRCIKKVDKTGNESRAIGICTKTVINRKGYTRGKFNCRGKRNITLKKRGSK